MRIVRSSSLTGPQDHQKGREQERRQGRPCTDALKRGSDLQLKLQSAITPAATFSSLEAHLVAPHYSAWDLCITANRHELYWEQKLSTALNIRLRLNTSFTPKSCTILHPHLPQRRSDCLSRLSLSFKICYKPNGGTVRIASFYAPRLSVSNVVSC